MRFLFSIVLFLCLSCISTAQTQGLLFEKTWSDYYSNGIAYVDELPNGDYFLVGWKILSFPNSAPGPPQRYACRIDPHGNIIWEKDWGNIFEVDYYGKTIKASDGSYMIAGSGLSGSGGGISDMTLTKIDSDGNILLYKFYHFAYADYASDIFETVDSCFILTGTAGITPNNWSPAYIKVNRDGNEVWRRTHTSLNNYSPFYTRRTPDNGFISAGKTGGQENSYYVKYDSLGSMSWIKYPFGTSLNDTIPNGPTALRSNQNGTFDIFYGTNYAVDPWHPSVYGFYRHYDSQGICISSKEYTQGFASYYLNDPDSSVWAISNNYNLYAMNEDSSFVRKVGLNGGDTLTKWVNMYIKTSDGGYMGVGQYTPDPVNVYQAFYIAKFGTDGRYQPDEFSESVSLYPNPTSDGNITLTFDMLTDETVEVRILSSDGKLIYTDAIFCPANSHNELPVRLYEESAAGGMYILEARTVGSVIRKKIVVMRKIK